MALDKSIISGKEKRKLYRRGTRVSGSYGCRNHGSCPYCTSNRLFQNQKLKLKIKEELKEIKNYSI
jgi:hypothetical protein